MPEITREQESAIARLAIDHASVAVAPQEDGTVKVTAGSRTLVLDEDGNTAPEPITHGYMRIPIETLRRLLGDERTDELLMEVADKSNAAHHLNLIAGDEFNAALGRLVGVRVDSEALATQRFAMSERVREAFEGQGSR